MVTRKFIHITDRLEVSLITVGTRMTIPATKTRPHFVHLAVRLYKKGARNACGTLKSQLLGSNKGRDEEAYIPSRYERRSAVDRETQIN